LVGVLAIAGTGIPGSQIGLGGFFSKDEILAVAFARAFEWDSFEKHEPHGEGHAQSEPGAQATGLVEGTEARRHEGTKLLLASDPVHPVKPAGHGEFGRAAIFGKSKPLPSWMFYVALLTAYVTPFYMMRAWWMTFMGKPRDHHVHDHAHENAMMFIPLVILAVGTSFSSYFLFRPLIADASTVATAAPMVVATDGHVHSAAIASAHHWLTYGVGFSFAVGFIVAIMIYGRGLKLAESIRRLPGVSLLHILLVNKYFIDEIYDLVWVKGCLLIAKIASFVDTWIVDLLFNTLAAATERLAAFSGLIIDTHGVDGVVNGMADTSMMVSDALRGPQTGRIRNYVLFAGLAAAIVLVFVLVYGLDGGATKVSAAVK